MNISRFLRRHFAANVRSRGKLYFRQGAVHVVQGTDSGVWTTVSDNEKYHVAVVLKNTDLHMSCNCPYVHDRGSGCKHMWTSIMAAEQHGYLGDILLQPKLEVLVNDEDFLDEVAGIGSNSKHGQAGSTRTLSKPPEAHAAKKERVADWGSVFSQVKQAMARPAQGAYGNEDWPEGRQVVYLLGVKQSLGEHRVVLDLGFLEQKLNGDWSKPKFHAITQQQAEQIHTEPDAAIMPLLFGAQEHQGYTYGYSYSYSSYHNSGKPRFKLSAPRLRAIMPLLGRSGRLFVRFGNEKAEIQPITWDNGLPWQLRLEVTEAGGKRHYVTGWLCRGDERQPVAQPRAMITNVLIWDDRAAFLEGDPESNQAWWLALRKNAILEVAAHDRDVLMRDLLLTPNVPLHAGGARDRGRPTFAFRARAG